MKYLLALVLSGYINALFAQWQPINSSTSDNGNIYHLNGNVGIGTSTINGNLQIGSGTGGGLVNLGGYAFAGCIRSSGDYFAGTNVLAQYGSSSENFVLRAAAAGNGFSAIHLSYTGDINFFTKSGTVNANDPINVTQSTYNALKITGSGYIGVGTITPARPLHINNSGGGIIRLQSPTAIWDVQSDAFSNGNFGVVNYTAGPADATKSFVLNGANGYLGVGTSTPLAKLHVVNGGQGLKLLTGSNSSGYDLSIGVNDDGVDFSNNSTGRGFNFSNASGNLLSIQSNGNVGIGTTSPDAKLAVSGQVHAQEVKVSVTVPGPDYVFEKDYQLTSLEDIKTYIEENKHLPEVPSAKEMEKNGVQLGEMNMLLLKKIEELTLYVIEQNKLISKQNERIVTLENKK